MLYSVLPISFIHFTIWPFVNSITMFFVILVFSRISSAVRPKGYPSDRRIKSRGSEMRNSPRMYCGDKESTARSSSESSKVKEHLPKIPRNPSKPSMRLSRLLGSGVLFFSLKKHPTYPMGSFSKVSAEKKTKNLKNHEK